MRYGTVPLARETGGLVDTVFGGKNGFTFGPPTAEAIHGALDRALETWHQKPDVWKKLIEAGMSGNYSWEKPAESTSSSMDITLCYLYRSKDGAHRDGLPICTRFLNREHKWRQ